MHSSFRNKYVVSPHSDQTLALLDATKEVDALARVRFLVSFLNTLGPWPSSAEQWPKGPDWQESASESRATPLRGSPTCSSQHVFGLVSGLGSPPSPAVPLTPSRSLMLGLGLEEFGSSWRAPSSLTKRWTRGGTTDDKPRRFTRGTTDLQLAPWRARIQLWRDPLSSRQTASSEVSCRCPLRSFNPLSTNQRCLRSRAEHVGRRGRSDA